MSERPLEGGESRGRSSPWRGVCQEPSRWENLLKLRSLHGRGSGRTLMRSGATLWSTALGARRAYVTVLHGRAPRQRIVSVAR